MFKRACGIEPKSDLPPGSADELVCVLENSGASVPGTIYSIVRPTIGPQDQVHLARPYYCNVIDQYISARRVRVIADSLVICWSDGLPEGPHGQGARPTPFAA